MEEAQARLVTLIRRQRTPGDDGPWRGSSPPKCDPLSRSESLGPQQKRLALIDAKTIAACTARSSIVTNCTAETGKANREAGGRRRLAHPSNGRRRKRRFQHRNHLAFVMK